MKDIGSKLRTLRELNNYKQAHVGNHLGIGQSAYSRIETGDAKNLTIEQLHLLAKFYKTTAAAILRWDGKINITSLPEIAAFHNTGINGTIQKVNEYSESERLRKLELKMETLLNKKSGFQY